MTPQDLTANREAEAGARRPACVERLEDPLPVLMRHSGTVVAQDNAGLVLFQPGAYMDATLGTHRLQGVAHQVDQHLTELARIRVEGERPRPQVPFELSFAGPRNAVQRFTECLCQIEPFPMRRLATTHFGEIVQNIVGGTKFLLDDRQLLGMCGTTLARVLSRTVHRGADGVQWTAQLQ